MKISSELFVFNVKTAHQVRIARSNKVKIFSFVANTLSAVVMRRAVAATAMAGLQGSLVVIVHQFWEKVQWKKITKASIASVAKLEKRQLT